MNVFLIQLLSFSSVLLFVLGLNALRHGSKATSLKTSRPGFFGWFPKEIEAVGQMLESNINSLFPRRANRSTINCWRRRWMTS